MRFYSHSLLWLALATLPCLAAQAEDSTPEPPKPLFGWADRQTINSLPEAERPNLDPVCPGAWLTPIPSKAKIGRPEDSNVEIQAEDINYLPQGISTLKGRVSIRQPGRRIDADNAELTQEKGTGQFSGNILIAEPGLVLTGDQADFDFETRAARIEKTEFIASSMNAHGHADQIVRDENGLITIARGEYSTCPPNDRTWSFIASDIRLNQQTGRGEVRHATLRVKDTPVFYLPYFNFPIDDRRQSGILIPRFGNTNDGGFDLAVPIYLNIAPNYDATITPRLITRRGSMVEGEFRYLLPVLGTGTLSGAYLPDDSLYQGRDRKSFSWQQSSTLSPNLVFSSNAGYVSDNAYFIDLGTDLNLTNTAFQERVATLTYSQRDWTLTGRVQGYQTIDPSITDIDKPYRRIPQILLEKHRPVAQGWQTDLLSELSYFEKNIADSSGPEINGARFRLDPSISYIARNDWGYITPRLGARTLGYELQGSGVGTNTSHYLAAPLFSIDSELVLEREQGRHVQTLEPRAYYLYSPYQDQNVLPNFDTAMTTFSYQQIFRDSRFSGGDRIDDANQLSLGLTSRLLNPNSGEERVRASIGQAFYLRDRKVRLDPTTPVATENNSGLTAEISAPIGRGWSGLGDAQWSSDREYLLRYSLNFNYLPESRDRLANLGYNFRRQDPALNQQAVRQISTSFVQPVGLNWQFLGLWQYDLRNREIQEALAGLQYEACCWKIRLYQRQFLADPDDISPGAQRERRAFFLEIELKGLAGLSSGVRSLLNNNVFGYNQLAEQKNSSDSPFRGSR